MSEKPQNDHLDWDNLKGPVPLNLIDSDFTFLAPDEDPEEESKPGTSSEILPLETVETLLAPPVEAASTKTTVTVSLSETANFRRLQAEALDQQQEKLKEQEQEDVKLAAEQKAKEESELQQQQRLEQWMANARNRLQMADSQPTAPGRPLRPRREPSPTMIHRVEMQKTIVEPGATESSAQDKAEEKPIEGFQDSSGYRTGKIDLEAKGDPMATLIVPSNTFAEPLGASETQKFKAIERKVAQLKMRESSSETFFVAQTPPAPERNNVRLAMWVLGGLIPVVLGLGLYALTVAGYLDGLEDLIPGMSRHISAQPASPAPSTTPPAKAPTAVAPVDAAPVHASVVDAPSVKASAVVAPPVSTPVVKAPQVRAPAVKTPPKEIAKTPTKPLNIQPQTKSSSKTNLPSVAPAVKPPPAEAQGSSSVSMLDMAAKAVEKTRHNIEASMLGVEVAKPAFGNETAISTQGEAALKSSVQEAIQAYSLSVKELFERFSMNMPKLAGDVVIGITVHPNGHILQGSISAGTTGSAAFEQELLRNVLDWKIASFPDNRPRYVAIPFHFDPNGP